MRRVTPAGIRSDFFKYPILSLYHFRMHDKILVAPNPHNQGATPALEKWYHTECKLEPFYVKLIDGDLNRPPAHHRVAIVDMPNPPGNGGGENNWFLTRFVVVPGALDPVQLELF